MGFDLAALPQDVRNHIIGYVAKMPSETIARAVRVNRELNQHPLLLKALLNTMQKLAKRASYHVRCLECGVNTAEDDDLAEAICVNHWCEWDDFLPIERSALACRNCLQYQWDGVTSTMDPEQNLPDALEADGSRICFMIPKPDGKGHALVPVRELSVVRNHGFDGRDGLLPIQSGSRSENPRPDWVRY